MVGNAQFESFIQHLLQQYDTADQLRQISSEDSDDAITNTVQELLLEAEIASHFDPMGYDNDADRRRVQEKLLMLQELLKSIPLMESSKEVQTINICIKFLKDGYALTQPMAEYLNKIYQTYG